MHRLFVSLVTISTLLISSIACSAEAELQGYGAFSSLNKDWMLMALYSDVTNELDQAKSAQRLEIKIATKKFSPRRFRSLWLEAIAVEHGTGKVDAMQAELKQFFNTLRGPLKEGDVLIVELVGNTTEVKINYHTLAKLSGDFLPTIVQSLIGKHPPTQALKAGLSGQSGLREQTNLGIRFDRLEPTLPRIAEISRWGKRTLAATL